MKKRSDRAVGRLFTLMGICLIAAAAILLISWQYGIRSSEQRASELVQTIRTIVPEPQNAAPEQRLDNTMPVLSIDGMNFVGILEMPKYGSCFPVCADWDKFSRYPSRLSGSIYDRSLQIGAATHGGQYDFYREISVGDSVFFTDMEGNRFSLEITAIRHEKHADQTSLQREDAALVLFLKNIYSFEYIVIFCDTLG